MSDTENSLDMGRSRVGLMIDGLPDTPPVSVKLERTSSRVELTIPFIDGVSDAYEHWFAQGILYGDDPDRLRRRYEPPNTLGFHDAYGSVGLVGSRVANSRRNLVNGIGQGRLTFDFTILGARSGAAHETINGFRSEIEGLGTWVGLRSLSANQTFNETGRLNSVDLRLQSSPPIRATQKLNAELQSNWRYGPGPGPDQTTISERMHVHTQLRNAVSWEDHLRIHFPIRNLLRVAAWRSLNFASHEAMSVADPLETMDGEVHGEQWLPVITERTGVSAETPAKLNAHDFLFAFNDIGSTGIGRWIELSHKLERGISPLVGLLDLKGATVEAHLAQVGIGFESLGYDLLIASGASKRAAGGSSWETRMRAVTAVASAVLPFSENEFVHLLRRNYRAVKHADQARRDLGDMHLAYLQAIQVFRAWAGVRLGVSEDRLKTALKHDQITRRIRNLQALAN